jgi:hypothetical protein
MARPALPADGAEIGTWGDDVRNAIWDTSDRADGRLPANVRTGTSYTAVTGDVATTVYRDLTVANTVTIPTGVGQPEDRILVRQKGTGTTSIVAGSGMTLVSVGRTAPFAMAGQGAIVEVVFESATRAYVDGAIA